MDALCGKNFDFFIISSNATNNYTLEVECSDRADEQLLTIIMGIIGKIIFFQKKFIILVMVVTQLAKQSLPTPAVLGSILVIGRILQRTCIYS